MNSENASNKIVQQLIDLANMAKGLMDEKTQELGRLFSSTRSRERRGKSSELLRLVLVNHLLQQQIQIILVLQHSLPQNGRLKKYGNQKQHQRNHKSLCRIEQPHEKHPVNLLLSDM